jgi:cytochrome c oxidase subunit 2
MRVHTYEKAFLAAALVLLLACLGALLYATAARGIHLPGHVAHIDPSRVHETAPFDQPGVRQTGPGKYEVIIIGHTWAFTPAEIRVPVGAEVTFVATTPDVIHGLLVARTRINAMLIPGQVTRVVHRFEQAGEYLLLCHEYCGLGHHNMAGKVIVE